MAKMIHCPACGNYGATNDDDRFEVRGQHDGRPIRKCMECGTGLYVRMLGRAQVIPHDTWVRMQDIWEAEFGAMPEAVDPLVARVGTAADDLVAGLPKSLPICLHTAFVATILSLRDAYPVVARGLDSTGTGAASWVELDEDHLRRVLRVGIAPNLVWFAYLADNRAYLAEGLHVRPSETLATVWKRYSEDLLTPEEALTLVDLPGLWTGTTETSFKFASTAVRALRRAAGFSGELGAIEALTWEGAFTHLITPVNDIYWAILDHISETLNPAR